MLMDKLEALERETAAVKASLAPNMSKKNSAVLQQSQFGARESSSDPLDLFIFTQSKNASTKKRNLVS